MMKAELVPVENLSVDPANARQHDKRNLATIKASLQRFGQQRPIVVGSDNVVVAGNGTLAAARELGWQEIAVVRTPLEGADRTAYAIADNRSAELAAWDFEPLARHLAALKADGIDLDDLGWAQHEWEPLLQAEWAPPAVEAMPGPGDEQTKSIVVTAEQRETIDAAVRKCRELAEDESLGEGCCVQLICAEYLEGK